MAFIRVVADVRVDFGGGRVPVDRKGFEVATGSGFVVAPSGLVLTSLHVVSDEPATATFGGLEAEVQVENRRIEVAIGSGGAVGVFEAQVVAADVANDLVALQVTASDLPYLPLGDSDAVEAGRPVKVLGFPFGRQIEVGKRADAGVVPQVSVTAGSFSAARSNEEGETRFLQTDASINPGNSGGPMLDEDGYVVGVVKMKLARDAASQGAGFSVPVNVAKDFLEANGLLELLPVARLRPGVRHTLDWKGVAIELPDGFSDQSTSRTLADGGEVGEIGFRAYRLATGWPVGGPRGGDARRGRGAGVRPGSGRRGSSATPRRREAVALPRGTRRGWWRRRQAPTRRAVRSGSSTRSSTAPKEKVVARYLGPADAVAFNLGLIRRSLESLEAAQMLLAHSPASAGRGDARARERVVPGGRGASPGPGGLAAGAGRVVGLRPAAPAGERPRREPPERLHAGAAGPAVDDERHGAGARPFAPAGRAGERGRELRRPTSRGTPGASSGSACRSRPAASS